MLNIHLNIFFTCLSPFLCRLSAKCWKTYSDNSFTFVCSWNAKIRQPAMILCGAYTLHSLTWCLQIWTLVRYGWEGIKRKWNITFFFKWQSFRVFFHYNFSITVRFWTFSDWSAVYRNRNFACTSRFPRLEVLFYRYKTKLHRWIAFVVFP